MCAVAVEALNDKDVVTRAVQLNGGDEEKPKDDDDDDDDVVAGSGSVIFNASISKLARVINEAHDNAAKRHQDAYREGFQVMSQLMNKLVERDAARDKRENTNNKLIERILARANDDAPEAAPDDVMGMFTQAALSRIFTPAGSAPAGGTAPPMNIGGMPIPPEYAAKLRDPKVLAQLRKILEGDGGPPPAATNGVHKPKA